MIELREPYGPRRVRPLGLWEPRGWKVKAYGIAYDGEEVDPDLVAASREAVEAVLPDPARSRERYGVGFAGVHDGRGGNLVFVDWWERENELHHVALVSDDESPLELEATPPNGPKACVWDLAVVDHERDAWVDHVLRNHEDPDVEGYLDDVLDGRV